MELKNLKKLLTEKVIIHFPGAAVAITFEVLWCRKGSEYFEVFIQIILEDRSQFKIRAKSQSLEDLFSIVGENAMKIKQSLANV